MPPTPYDIARVLAIQSQSLLARHPPGEPPTKKIAYDLEWTDDRLAAEIFAEYTQRYKGGRRELVHETQEFQELWTKIASVVRSMVTESVLRGPIPDVLDLREVKALVEAYRKRAESHEREVKNFVEACQKGAEDIEQRALQATAKAREDDVRLAVAWSTTLAQEFAVWRTVVAKEISTLHERLRAVGEKVVVKEEHVQDLLGIQAPRKGLLEID